MKLTIEINMDGAAFDEYPELEVERILNRIGEKLVYKEDIPYIRDINGNKCATVLFTEE